MARVTVEDCLKVIPNSFDLVILAAKRARDLYAGAERLIDSDEKEPIVALREIAANKLDIEVLKLNAVKDVVSGKNRYQEDSNLSFDNILAEEEESQSEIQASIQNNIFGMHDVESEE